MTTTGIDINPIVESVATEYYNRFKKWGIERIDLAQELHLWVWQHPLKIAEWTEEEEWGSRALVKTLRHEAARYAQEWKAQYLGYSVDDIAWWVEGEIKALLPAMFNRDAWTEPPVSDDRSGKLPGQGGNWVTSLADLSLAYDKLGKGDQEILRAFYADGYTNILMADVYGVTERSMSHRHEGTVKRLHKLLGGGKPRNVHDANCACATRPDENPHCECRCYDYVGTRRTVSNAAARVRTDSSYQDGWT